MELPPKPEGIDLKSAELIKAKQKRVKTWSQDVAVLSEYEFRLFNMYIKNLWTWIDRAYEKGEAHDKKVDEWRKKAIE